MRAFLLFCLYVGGLFLGGALLEYPIYRVAHAFDASIDYWTFSGRLTIPLGVLTLYPLLRRLRLANAKSLGYALPRRRFAAALAMGIVLGILMMLPLFGVLIASGARAAHTVPQAIPAALLGAAGGAAFSGLMVGFIEETFFRGAMYTAVERESGSLAAVLASSLLYSVVHFIDSDLRVPDEAIGWTTGLVILADSFRTLADPARFLDSALALAAAGAFLALVRRRTGHLAWCIGLHAGWVFAIKEFKTLTHPVSDAPWAWLAGSYDHITGWAALAWLGLLSILLLWPAQRCGRKMSRR